MSGSAESMLIQVAYDLKTTRYLTIASFVALLYENILMLPDEIALIWNAPWTSGKWLYLANRYPPLLEGIVWVVYTLDLNANPKFCIVVTFLDAWATLVLLLPVQTIVILRTFALWNRSRKIIVGLICAVIAADATMLVCIALVVKSIKYSPNPLLQPVLGCNSGLQSVSRSTTIPAWAALMVFDTLIFLLTLTRIIQNFKTGRTHLMKVLFRDGFLYYAAMLAASIGNLIIYSALPVNREALVSALLPLFRMTMCVTASRIILNIRGVISEDVQLVAQPAHSRDNRSSAKTPSALSSLEVQQVLDIKEFTVDPRECV